MNRSFLIILFLLNGSAVLSQKIVFPKTNYADSIVLSNAVKRLAQDILAKYPQKNKGLPTNDDLIRLNVAAGNYEVVPKILREVNFALEGDSISTKDIDFNYKLYALIMKDKPAGKTQFDAAYARLFPYLYNDMSLSCKTYLEKTLSAPLQPVQDQLKAAIQKFSKSDSLTRTEAVAFCRAYAGYETAAALTALNNTSELKMEKDNYIIADSVLVKMPDGGTIALNIIRDKKLTTPQPVVLMYNIYADHDFTSGKRAVLNGFTGITANTRGKRLSSDAIEPYEHDAKDAYYIIDWISKQPWCNGKIGMYGGSYVGFSQWAAVKYIHPALKTIVPMVSVGAGIDFPATHGIYMTYMLRWIHYVTDTKMTDKTGFNDINKWTKVTADWYKTGKSYRSLDSIEGRPSAIFQRWLQHPTYDAYWQSMTPQKAEFSKINIPILSTTGYYDDDQLGAMYYYRQYHQWNKNPDYYLVMGPYSHRGAQAFPEHNLRGYEIDSVANFPITDLIFQWFNFTLKNGSRPAILKDKVNFEVMGKNQWLHVPSLAKMSNDTLKFYLGNTGTGKTHPLLTKQPVKKGFIKYDANLKDRSGTQFGESDEGQNIIDSTLDSKDKLVFKSAPLKQPIIISGAFKASLLTSINKKDVDLVIELYEQTPDGKFFYLKSNIERASLVRDRSKRHLLKPNKPVVIAMNDNFITSRQLQKGSRIVVVLGVNKNPDWQINYGSGKDVSDETMADAAIPMHIKWFNHSVIRIPILK